MSKLSATLLLLLCACAPAHAQDDRREREGGHAQQQQQQECPEPVYKLQQVSAKPRIISKPEPRYTEAARRNKVSGRVLVEAVLCKTGKVTDVTVIKGLPHGLNESAMRAARGIRFEPGELDGEAVSVRIRLVYGFDIY